MYIRITAAAVRGSATDGYRTNNTSKYDLYNLTRRIPRASASFATDPTGRRTPRIDPASLGAGSQAPRFNAAVVAWPLSCCGIAMPVSFAMHLFNPLGVCSYRESRAVL